VAAAHEVSDRINPAAIKRYARQPSVHKRAAWQNSMPEQQQAPKAASHTGRPLPAPRQQQMPARFLSPAEHPRCCRPSPSFCRRQPRGCTEICGASRTLFAGSGRRCRVATRRRACAAVFAMAAGCCCSMPRAPRQPTLLSSSSLKLPPDTRCPRHPPRSRYVIGVMVARARPAVR